MEDMANAHCIDILEPNLHKKTYCIRCRLCRKELIVSNKVKLSHSSEKAAETCGNCLFLDEEFLCDWIKHEIDNSSWTKGRLKCPRVSCPARVGGFDFVQGLLCGCGKLTIPAIWIQYGKVDVMAINSDCVMSTGTPSVVPSEKSCSGEMPVSEGSSNGSKPMSLISNDNLGSKCDLKADILKAEFPYTGNDKETSRVNMADEVEQARTVNDINITGDIPSVSTLIQRSFCDGRARRETCHPILQCIDEQPLVRQRKNKSSQNEAVFVEQALDKTHDCITDKSSAQMKMTLNGLPNRFNPLSIEETGVVKPVQTNASQAMNEHLICAVCLDYFYKPYQCPCSHIFCESCLRQLYHNRVGTLKCPICRDPIKYVETADQVRKEILQLPNPEIKQRERFEKSAKYRTWPLPPIGPLPFLRKRHTLCPKRDRNILILAVLSLLVVCYAILFLLS